VPKVYAPGLNSAVIQDGALKPWDQEMCALWCSLRVRVSMSIFERHASKIDLALDTRESVKHDRTVTPRHVIDTCLEQGSGNADRYYTQSEHMAPNLAFVHTHQ